MNIEPSARQILPFVCPSIQYRIKKELLFQSPNPPEMAELQSQISQDETVKGIIDSQGLDGWMEWNFHGYDSMEADIRLLCEKGLEPTQPVLARALKALEQHTDRLQRGIRKIGKILDDLGFGGSETIRAYLFAQAGCEEHPFVQEKIEQSLELFNAVIEIESPKDLYQLYQGKKVFREGVRFPSIYHLRILAWTQNWRTPQNHNMIAKSIQRLVQLSPIPNIYVRYKSQVIAPASFCMDNFRPDMNELTDAEWMLWFHRMEHLARLGVVSQIPELKSQVQALECMLEQGQGIFTKKLSHPYFQKWGAYTGLALEKDWRAAQRRINDLTFRSLLILYYSNFTR
ncbi:MAG TPA: hypothetical protein VMT73_03220 [Anaerolineales bacterium]|nr:hypothetical protein [Anaerolineales bacterium]